MKNESHVAATVVPVGFGVSRLDFRRAFLRESDLIFTYKYSGGEAHWGVVLKINLCQWYAWGLLAPCIIWLARRFPLEHGHWTTSLVVHLLAGGSVALVKWQLDNLLRHYVLGFGRGTSLIFAFHQSLMTYWLLVGAAQTYLYYQRYREGELRSAQLSAQLAQAQLQALRMQLHPHFLFNTLNAISTLVHKDPEAADRMIARLSELLRLTLENVGVQEVPLAQELEFLERYLEIERTRFADRLVVRMEIAPETLDAWTHKPRPRRQQHPPRFFLLAVTPLVMFHM